MSGELFRWLGLVGALGCLLACAGTVVVSHPTASGGSGGSGGQGGANVAGGGGTGGYGGGGSDGGASLPGYVDSGCPPAGPHITDYTCNPFDPGDSGCPGTEGCYIYADNPSGASGGCGQEVYGSECSPQGPGTQGDPCGGATDCLGGYSCVVTAEGTQCAKLCSVSGVDDCDDGEVCNPIDVEGFGGCL
jgi:hypothetical protein